jgi:hypothetical protein
MSLIKNIKNLLLSRFEGQEYVSRSELYEFYREFDPDLNEGTFGWRIYELKQKHIIKDVRKGIYTLESKQTFKPEFNKTILKIARILESSFDHHAYNIWNTAWLNEVSELQATSFLIILEIDKDSVERVFYTVKDAGVNNVYLKPDKNMIATYISELPEAVVVEPMISRAPVRKLKNVIIPRLEKILVDLYCDEELFFAFQGNQLVKIFEGCFQKYLINFSTMFNYARRRHREDMLKEFLGINFPDQVKELLND